MNLKLKEVLWFVSTIVMVGMVIAMYGWLAWYSCSPHGVGHPADCPGYGYLEPVRQNGNTVIVEIALPSHHRTGEYILFLKVPNARFLDGFELVSIMASDNYTQLSELSDLIYP